ncbi:P-loop containing nucleoside triphosphate hydrolase protein [Lophiostoma macrostomum CBS 122681]|uniref:P-loop containing nucleoside triphosphate hydrolase protein n=1 Tax=Lophiostoma macrostomum CBS 122681 TaxID=1314788 RepID=A0A6A6SVI4_9PLEO|nr:P-loop containing nucleoside triphosphate hydrolase protein [Lophiostoma macrostomum CBS 122681]
MAPGLEIDQGDHCGKTTAVESEGSDNAVTSKTTASHNGAKEPDTVKNSKRKGKGKKDGKSKERIQRLDQLYSKKKRQTYFVPTPNDGSIHSKHTQDDPVVLKVRRIICDKGFPSGTEIDIKSDALKNTLVEIFQGIEGLKLNEEPPITSPELLFHAQASLQDRMKSETANPKGDQGLIDHLSVASQYISEDHGSTLQSLASLTSHDEITFNLLWALFPPGAAIYTKENILREDQLMKQVAIGEYLSRSSGARYFQLKLRLLSHDGQKMGWVDTEIEIDDFEGAKKVHNLKCFPLGHHPDRDNIRTRLLQRGKRYLELLQATYQEYSGAAITEDREVNVGGEYKKVMIHISGRIMVDPVILFEQNNYTDLLKPEAETEVHIPSLRDADIIYCNHHLGGFSFRQKEWCCFAIGRLRPIIWNDNAFAKLVMEPRRRDLIHTLVRSHKHGPNSFDDIVSGKGQGLVGLLSGNPGVGKTLTAEVIAEATRRPLYMLSAGELGTYTNHVEENLGTILEVTRAWGCVLLIDEADVFLQARDGLDLERNALVSIFLRRLEYFQGVLIMTTNRKSTIDKAFDSRIHFKLYYPDLAPESRAAIWRNCLDNVSEDVAKVQCREGEIAELAKLQLNGRQIKNAVACAVSIAVEQGKALTAEHVRDVLDLVIEPDTDA